MKDFSVSSSVSSHSLSLSISREDRVPDHLRGHPDRLLVWFGALFGSFPYYSESPFLTLLSHVYCYFSTIVHFAYTAIIAYVLLDSPSVYKVHLLAWAMLMCVSKLMIQWFLWKVIIDPRRVGFNEFQKKKELAKKIAFHHFVFTDKHTATTARRFSRHASSVSVFFYIVNIMIGLTAALVPVFHSSRNVVQQAIPVGGTMQSVFFVVAIVFITPSWMIPVGIFVTYANAMTSHFQLLRDQYANGEIAWRYALLRHQSLTWIVQACSKFFRTQLIVSLAFDIPIILFVIAAILSTDAKNQALVFYAEIFWLLCTLSHLYIQIWYASTVHTAAFAMVPLLYRTLSLRGKKTSGDYGVQKERMSLLDSAFVGSRDVLDDTDSVEGSRDLPWMVFLQRMRDVPTGFDLGGPTIVITRRTVATITSILVSCFFIFRQIK